MPSKYIIVNGKTKINPEYGQTPSAPVVANPQQALTCQYTIDDANEVAEVTNSQLAPSTLALITTVQDDSYTDKFQVANLGSDELLDTLSTIFSRIQAPIGLANKLIALQSFNLHFKIDDSGSMSGICANGKSRWKNVEERLLELLEILQVVPTGPITISFLDRRAVIVLSHYGKTPARFFAEACALIRTEFRRGPNGSTPIVQNVQSMLQMAQGKTAHFLFTDGEPNGAEREIQQTKDVLLRRRNPLDNPFTFLCCSDKPEQTMWMHEIEEIACRPGSPGYVAAVQNFLAEQIEVLNDQGPAFPYSRGMWLLCNLLAALNPYDLDALDQHEPLTKETYDNFAGRICTFTEYQDYFFHHPNAPWLFTEDFNAFLTVPLAMQIPAVNYFQNGLATQLNADINNGNDFSEPRAIAMVERALLANYRRHRHPQVFQARNEFWDNHCLAMERAQLANAARRSQQPEQSLWGDYIALSGLGQLWTNHLLQLNTLAPAVPIPAVFASAAGGQDSNGPPPAYDEAVPVSIPPTYPIYAVPTYYRGYVNKVASANNYSGNYPGMFQQAQASSGGLPYNQSSSSSYSASRYGY